jgi:putative intracellular protease/amidase/ketosteroid isomerase-like protein
MSGCRIHYWRDGRAVAMLGHMTNRSVLIALTSHEQLGITGRATGYYLSEVAHPWRVFTDAGYTVDLVSVQGGEPPRDPGVDLDDPVQREFLTDPRMGAQLRDTPNPEGVDPDPYDAILFAGGHGTMWDFPDSAGLARLARHVYERGGVIAAVCHGPAALVNVALSDGSYLVDGRRVAAFTDEEESAVGLDGVVPFSLQAKLTERGAHHVRAPKFTAQVVRDGRLVTGQNPASATGVAEQTVAALATGTARRITESYFAAENRRDLDAILGHFAEDVRFLTPDGQVLTGQEALRPFYATNIARLPTLHVRLVDDLGEGDRAALEWRAEGGTPDGQAVHMHGTNLVSIRDGRFGEFRAYWCTSAA